LTIWTHSVYEVNISNSEGGLEYYEYHPNSVWAIESTLHSIKAGAIESEVTFTFKLRRKPSFYILNLILPILFLGNLNLIVFAIPTQSEEKVAFTITLFLSFAVFLNVLQFTLPANSENTSILCLYLIIELAIGVIILVVTAIQVRICNRNPSIPFNSFHRKVLKLSKCFICYRHNSETKVTNLEKEVDGSVVSIRSSTEETDWSSLCTAIDILAFHLLLVVQVIVLVILVTTTHVNR
jgi:hypothetical protein